MKRPPWGVQGGEDAAPACVRLLSGGVATQLQGKSVLRVQKGDLLYTQWCGAGGYGDPLQRDPDRVLADVLDEKVSVDRAREVYGVVIDVGASGIDESATAAQRAHLAARRQVPAQSTS